MNNAREIGYDIPARPGMTEAEVATPALILDLDALERNIAKLAAYCAEKGMRLRPHGKMHKSVDVAKLQIAAGAVGLCCQKVSEAEVFARAGITDVLVTNEVRGPAKCDRLARLPLLGCRVGVCVDDIAGIAELAEATARHGTTLEVLVEVDVGAGRCGVSTATEAVAIARAIDRTPGLTWGGVQAYHGSMQHYATHAERATAFDRVLATLRPILAELASAGLPAATVTGGGTGSYRLETGSGVYTDLQCGSYAFMDAHYGRLTDESGARLDAGAWENALFVLTEVMSTPVPGRAICDAGLKAQSVDSGLPRVFGRGDLTCASVSDEHGTLADPGQTLKVGDRLRLVPGHCDPTVNLWDWYVGMRGGRVEALWPVSARGKVW